MDDELAKMKAELGSGGGEESPQLEQGDEPGFQELWSQMLELVAADGKAIDEEELTESDVILPPRDISFAEAAGEFTGEGLIPD